MSPEDKMQALEDLQKMIGWKVLLEHMKQKQEGIKTRLLTEKNILKVRQLQDQYGFYQATINYVVTKGGSNEED